MFHTHRTASGIFKLIEVALALVGLALATGLTRGTFRPSAFYYFTNISNLAAALYFLFAGLLLCLGKATQDTICPAIKGIVTMGLTVTMLIAHFMLGGLFMNGSFSMELTLLHYLCPILVILDWLLFDEKGQVKAYSPFLWVIFPLVYLAYAMISVTTGFMPNVPYPFLDYPSLGTARVVSTVFILLGLFLLLGYIVYGIDHFAARRRQKNLSA